MSLCQDNSGMSAKKTVRQLRNLVPMTLRFPFFTICALLVAPLFCYASIPLWRLYISNRAGSNTKTLYFAEYGVATGAFLSAVAGAAVGLIFTVLARSRRERFPPLRALGFICNLGLLGYGLFVVLTTFRFQ
jgi:hypothetical protein